MPGIAGEFAPVSYPEIQASSGILPFGLRHYWKGHFVRDLEPSAIEAVVAGMRDVPGGHSFMLLEAIGGQARIEPPGGAAFGQREAAGTSAPSASGRTRPTTRRRSRGRGGPSRRCGRRP